MITGKSERFKPEAPGATAAISPGHYKTNKSTLKRSRYNGMAPFMQMARKRSIFDEAVARAQNNPGAGYYEQITPMYIRGQNQLSSQFSSQTARFSQDVRGVPGPGEYFQPREAPQKNPVKPAAIKVQKEPQAPSIPFEAQPLQKNPLKEDPRAAWICAAGPLDTPNPQQYDPTLNSPLPKEVQIQIPVGGGGTSLARYEHPSAWAVAGERFQEQPGALKVGPGSYQIPTSIQPQKKQSNAFATKRPRFDSTVQKADNLAIGPGSYSVIQGTIEAEAQKILQEATLKREMKQRLTAAEALQQEEGSKKATSETAQKPSGPAVGSYNIVQEKKFQKQSKLTLDAQMRLALLSTFQVEKWNPQGASIPARVLTDEPAVPPTSDLDRNWKKEKPGMLEKQPERFRESPRSEDSPGPGYYLNPSSNSQKKIRPSAVFTSSLPRGDAALKRIQAETETAAEARKMAEEEAALQRMVGGPETAVHYNKAKVQADVQVPFGTSQRRFDEAERNANPGPGDYQVERSGVASQRKHHLYTTERSPEIPGALKNATAPGATRALEIVQQRKVAAQQLGPGCYDTARPGAVKKSFNAGCLPK